MLRAVETEYKVAKGREATLLANVTQLGKEGQDLSAKEIQYLSLQRENETNQQLFESVAQTAQGAGVPGGLETTTCASSKRRGLCSRRSGRAAASRSGRGILGLVLGLGTAVAMEYFDGPSRPRRTWRAPGPVRHRHRSEVRQQATLIKRQKTRLRADLGREV